MKSEVMGPKFLIFYSLILLVQKTYSALTIKECPDEMRNVPEDSKIRLTCGQYLTKIEWYHSYDRMLRGYIGNCIKRSCDPTQRNQLRLDAEWASWAYDSSSYKSTLDITTVTRDEAGFFHCRNYYTDDRASCRLRVTASAEVVFKNCSVGISDWQVKGECLVEKMYASDDVYTCTWSVKNIQVPGVFQRPLSSYQSRGRTYMRGVCSFIQQIPFNGYSFTSSISYTYKISIDPGPQDSLVTTIKIEPPKKPEINCSEIVHEGSTVICNCTSQNKGNPPAKFVWDGINTDRLLLQNVSRQQSFTNYTCRQTWDPIGVINTTVHYTFKVAYGPSAVDISIVISENGAKSFMCTAKDVFPSAIFRWNITCDKKNNTMTTSTCTLPRRGTDDDIVVQCTASNTAFPDLSVTKIFVGDYTSTKTEISSSGTEQANEQSKYSSSSDTNNGGLIGGVVAAVIFAIIVGAVIAVIIVKRRKEFSSERFSMKLWPCAFKFFHKKSPLPTPYATVNKPTSATPITRLAAPSGDLYTRPASTISIDYNGEYVTVSDTVDNTVDGINKDVSLMTNQSKHEMTDLKETAKRTNNPKPTSAATNNFQDTIGSVYMNVTEVPTDSGLGVYHIVPWRTMSTQETDTRNDGAAAAVSEDEYNALNFEEDRSGQEDQAATYHHLEHE
ncbi:uncharacterized protein LOC112569091 isoform X2 [Pomacea canaliculata]|uniref:uncharacterized protein LOC112569091 isoform X2 n=1 Tax=Pomacea canaliculata TaxID=400727 RepID=UPI000D728642|nr:uncharacterized protein LOC112569091 isoform X2 [Pomacea canaliculata]